MRPGEGTQKLELTSLELLTSRSLHKESVGCPVEVGEGRRAFRKEHGAYWEEEPSERWSFLSLLESFELGKNVRTSWEDLGVVGRNHLAS